MALPVPDLDDRRFQDLVDDAKRLVQRRCPEWTDHNVSDPGVTLIETFASMVDQLSYRLNRVPGAHYLRFLDLIGVQLYPPTAARTQLTYWLSGPHHEPVTVPRGNPVSTPRVDGDQPVIFTTTTDLTMPSVQLDHVFTAPVGGEPTDRGSELELGEYVSMFAKDPAPGDSVLFGLSAAAPSCAVMLRLICPVEGIAVDPKDPPLVWEAWTASGWVECEMDKDTTGGFNRAGDVIIHLPSRHTTSTIGRRRAGWIRCRLTEPEPGQPFYRASPRLQSAVGHVIGGTVEAVNAVEVTDEILGISEGVPGQRFTVEHKPIVPSDEPPQIQVASDDNGWADWQQVDSFAHSGPDDKHFVIDLAAGEIVLGPMVRELDGAPRQFGAIPEKGCSIRIRSYRTGGGQRGNVARGVLRIQRESLPVVHRVENRRSAVGGVDGESVEEAARRGPIVLRSRERAVTVEDYEQLAKQAAPDIARVRCVPVTAADGGDSASVRVLVVPSAPAGSITAGQRTQFADLVPSEADLATIARYLDDRRCIGTRVVVEPPFYQGVTVVARIQAKRRVTPDGLRDRALAALFNYLDPLTGGPDKNGWPFGRPVQAGEIFAVLQNVTGVELIEDVRLFAADPITGERGSAVQRLDLDPNSLVFSHDHQVRITR